MNGPAETLAPQDPEIKNEREKLKESISINSLNSFGNGFLNHTPAVIKHEELENVDKNLSRISFCD